MTLESLIEEIVRKIDDLLIQLSTPSQSLGSDELPF